MEELNRNSIPLARCGLGGMQPPKPIGFGRRRAILEDSENQQPEFLVEATHSEEPIYHLNSSLLDDDVPSGMNCLSPIGDTGGIWSYFEVATQSTLATNDLPSQSDPCLSWASSPEFPSYAPTPCQPDAAYSARYATNADSSLWPTQSAASTASTYSTISYFWSPLPPTNPEKLRRRKYYGPFEACSRADVLPEFTDDDEDGADEVKWLDRDARLAELGALAQWRPQSPLEERFADSKNDEKEWSLEELERYMTVVRNRLLAAWHTHPAPREQSLAERELPGVVHAKPVYRKTARNTIVSDLEMQCEWMKSRL